LTENQANKDKSFNWT